MHVTHNFAYAISEKHSILLQDQNYFGLQLCSLAEYGQPVGSNYLVCDGLLALGDANHDHCGIGDQYR